MPALSVRLFGQCSICCRGTPLEDLIPGKAKELFCYLLTHRQRPIAREALANVLWDDCTTEHSKQYLRKCLWQLHQVLCHHGAAAMAILQVNSQWISLSPEADVWVDVAEFERYSSCAQASLTSPDASHLKAWETAVNLYQGDLLEGWYQDWCIYDRERLQNRYLLLLDKLAFHAAANRQYEKGLDYATRILRFDRAHEIAHQHLMQLHYLSGDRTGAVRQYENCKAALREELGVQPSHRTRQLHQQILEDLVPVVTTGAKVDREALERPLLKGALDRLLEVKQALTVLQNVVDDSVARVREALHAPDKNRPNQTNALSSDSAL